MKIALMQTSLHWQQPIANRAMLEEKIWNNVESADLLVLPEMFTTGFSMETSAAEPSHIHTLKWMQQMAKQGNMAVAGSVMTAHDKGFVNRLYWVQPDEKVLTYDKRHLFRMAKEHENYQAGSEKLLISWRGFTFCPMICYDLRFPVWSRNMDLQYDVLLYVANWPMTRVSAWSTLLRARAIENLSYCIGVNRTGSDGNDVAYNGRSACFDFKGDTLLEFEDEDAIRMVEIDKTNLDAFREKFPAHLDQDCFTLHS